MTNTPPHLGLAADFASHLTRDCVTFDPVPVNLTRKRRFVHITRCMRSDDSSIVDAIADDGTAWTRHGFNGATDKWRQLPPLPERED